MKQLSPNATKPEQHAKYQQLGRSFKRNEVPFKRILPL